MKLSYDTKLKIFTCKSDYHERGIPKAAGFWFHWGDPDKCRAGVDCKMCNAGYGKVWWSPNEACAHKLIKFADQSAKSVLGDHEERLEESRAVDADIDVPSPEGLEYMPFQRAGIAYAMSRNSTLIGDEMGLGKTIQALGVINADPKIATVIIIVPASLRVNWLREAEKWLTREFKFHVVDKTEAVPEEANCVIVNYDRLKGKVLESLAGRKFDLMVVDECHKVKNPKAKRTKTILGYYDRKERKRIEGLVDNCKRRVFLTGTPFLNRPIEIQPIAGALDPKNFGNFFSFAKRYCNAHEGRYGWDFSGSANLGELQERLRSSIMVRRLKKQVLTELPEKRRQVVTLPLNGSAKAVKAEATLYSKHQKELERLRAEVDLAHAAGNEAEYKKAVDKLRDASQLAFTEISKARHDVAVAKVPNVIEHVESTLESVDKVIVFAHHKDVIAALMNHFGNKAVQLTGSDKQEDRQRSVDRFQGDPECSVFVGSIQAAGVGLTLTAASHVIFAELDWVPANVTQAEDRAHRIGQKDQVLVQHLVVDGSLDARMARVLVAKQELADKALDDPTVVVLPEPEGREIHPKPKKYPEATKLEREAAAKCLRILAGVCDGARKEDGHGFNKPDAFIGHQLAERSFSRDLTDGEVFLSKIILPKYHRQLPVEVLQVLKKGASDGKSEATAD